MSRKWQWLFLGLLVAIVTSGLMPNALLSEAEASATGAVSSSVGDTTGPIVTPLTVAMPIIPLACTDASCGKGAPAPTVPTLTVVAAAAVVGVLALTAPSRRARRPRSHTAPLPRGNFLGLYHPPQFS